VFFFIRVLQPSLCNKPPVYSEPWKKPWIMWTLNYEMKVLKVVVNNSTNIKKTNNQLLIQSLKCLKNLTFLLRTTVYSKQKSVFHLDWFHCMKLQEFYIELFLKHYNIIKHIIIVYFFKINLWLFFVSTSVREALFSPL
jgi:hypothetical protein